LPFRTAAPNGAARAHAAAAAAQAPPLWTQLATRPPSLRVRTAAGSRDVLLLHHSNALMVREHTATVVYNINVAFII